MMTEAAALEALDATVRAYNYGQGASPLCCGWRCFFFPR